MTIIEKMDGSRFDMTKYGFAVLKVGPPDVIYDSENIAGRPGRNRTSRYHGIRKLQLKISLQAKSQTDAIFIEEQLAEIFDYAEDFYVYQQVGKSYGFEVPGESSFSTAQDAIEWTPHLHKRWRVERINNDAIEWDGLKGRRVIELETCDLPYAETPFTAQQLANSAKEWGNDMLAWGLGLDWVNDLPQYTFTSNSFEVQNIGTVEINPRYMPLRFELTGNFASYVQIENLKTGDVFRLNKRLGTGDKLVLDGVNYLVNGLSDTHNTNKKLIRLSKGVNQFAITGGTVNSFKVDCPFYFI